jgi:hypothetical protein
MRKRLTNHLANKTAAAGLRREISDDFKYDKKKIKHLKHILHNVNVAVGTLVSALNEFSGVKGPSISPDGLIGGLGYIMPLKNIKEVMNTSIHNLSDVSDSIADELTNPHWNAEDDKDVKDLIKEKEDVEEKAEEIGEGGEKDEEKGEETKEEPPVAPDDVITSKEIIASDKSFEKAVKRNLVRFSSHP